VTTAWLRRKLISDHVGQVGILSELLIRLLGKKIVRPILNRRSANKIVAAHRTRCMVAEAHALANDKSRIVKFDLHGKTPKSGHLK
jgi:hypothetical protein